MTSNKHSDEFNDRHRRWHFPIRDKFYSLIEPESRGKNKHELFGMAKSFPQVTRDGYKSALMDNLSEEEIIQARKEHYFFSLRDYGPFYRLKTKYHAEFAEFLGMFVFLSIGYGSSCQHYIGNGQTSNWTALTLTWGFGNMAGIYVSGGYSGAHLNPIVTLNLWFFRGFPFRRMFTYFVCQLLGALCACAWVFILYYPFLRNREPNGWTLQTAKVFYANINDEAPTATGWFNEVTGSALLHTVIFSVGDSHNIAPAPGMNALVIGFTVMALGCSFGHISAFGLNPFRDFGPRLFLSMVGIPKQMWTARDWWWVTGLFTGPLTGGLIGALAYDLFLFDGPESPINFPPGIKKRALKFMFEDILHPFSNRTPIEGKVQIEGQPAG